MDNLSEYHKQFAEPHKHLAEPELGNNGLRWPQSISLSPPFVLSKHTQKQYPEPQKQCSGPA